MTDRPDLDARAVASAYRAANDALDERPSADARAAILAAAARSVDAKPRAAGAAPKRWRAPLAAAVTVLVSAIAVIVAQRTEREMLPVVQEKHVEPNVAVAPPPPAEAPRAAAPAAPAAPAGETKRREPAPSAETRRHELMSKAPAPEQRAPERQQRETLEDATVGKATGARSADGAVADVEAPPAAAPKPAAPPASFARDRRADVAAESPAIAAAGAAPESPERWLARIIELRRAGRDDEADTELKKLRERHPDLMIPAAALRATGTR